MYQRIRDLREDRDLTQAQLAAYLHCTQPAYSQYERGLRNIPQNVILALAKFYGVSTDYLYGLTDDPTPSG